MKLRPEIKICAELTVDDREAEIIYHLTSYSLADWFEGKCSTRFTKEQIIETLSNLNQAAYRLVNAREAAKGIVGKA